MHADGHPFMKAITRYFRETTWLILGAWLFAGNALQADRSVTLSTLPGKLRFDIAEFSVLPGEKVALTFINNDEMVHNWVLIRGDASTTMMVAQKAWAMGDAAADRQFVPEIPEVILHFTKVLESGEKEFLEFVAPLEEGSYPYVCTLPGHAFSMKGVMKVLAAPAPDQWIVRAQDDAVSEDPLTLHPHHAPIVKRAFVEEGPPRSVLMGFPGGVNACFDAETCVTSFGWFGPFLDIGPDWGRNANQRGGGPVKVLGERFSSSWGAFPLRLGAKTLTPQVVFKGYELRGVDAPVMEYTVNGAWIQQVIEPSDKGVGLKHTFTLDSGVVTPVYIYLDRSQCDVEASAGKWDGNWLAIEPEDNHSFSIQTYHQP